VTRSAGEPAVVQEIWKDVVWAARPRRWKRPVPQPHWPGVETRGERLAASIEDGLVQARCL
jgi:hypothetical protein